MKRILGAAAALATTTTLASAAGVDRSGQPIGVIFEQGNYAELSFGIVSPDVSGTAVPLAGGFGSGDAANSYTQLGLAYKHQFTDEFSAALIFDQPFGAQIEYPTGTGYFAAGSSAELKSNSLTAVVRYKFANNFSVHGGIRYQELQAEVSVPFIAGYAANTQKDGGVGYVAGVAYEKPEIAMRVALTYNSEIDHDLDTTESFGGVPVPGTSNTPVTTPASWNLDFQSGIAENTLLFGSVRYAENTTFRVEPANYPFNPIVSFASNGLSYNLGVGRRFNDNWAGAVSVGWDKESGGFSSNLAPTDGNISLGLGATYTSDSGMKITGGVRYIKIGNAQTQGGGLSPIANFRDNKAIAAGIKIGFNF